MRKDKRTPAGRETIPPDLAQRCLRIATYMLEHHATVRQAAKAFGLSKSSVHKDMHQRLPQLSESLGRQVELLCNTTRPCATCGAAQPRGKGFWRPVRRRIPLRSCGSSLLCSPNML